LISTHPLAIIDFHATWCGPCHAIAPFYTSLAQKHSSPNRIIFTKCDVDAQSSIARTYSVTAMPTFIILHQGKEVARVSGADRSSLGREVEKWVQEMGGAMKGFTGSGQVLGGEKP
ncbi:thioredoxin-like protein, partial [Terfezia claveryi]